MSTNSKRRRSVRFASHTTGDEIMPIETQSQDVTRRNRKRPHREISSHFEKEERRMDQASLLNDENNGTRVTRFDLHKELKKGKLAGEDGILPQHLAEIENESAESGDDSDIERQALAERFDQAKKNKKKKWDGEDSESDSESGTSSQDEEVEHDDGSSLKRQKVEADDGQSEVSLVDNYMELCTILRKFPNATCAGSIKALCKIQDMARMERITEICQRAFAAGHMEIYEWKWDDAVDAVGEWMLVWGKAGGKQYGPFAGKLMKQWGRGGYFAKKVGWVRGVGSTGEWIKASNVFGI